MMDWLTLTLISVVIVSFSSILQRVLMKSDKSDPASYAVAFHFLTGSVFMIAALAFGLKLPPVNSNLFLFWGSAALWGAGTVLLFKALKLLESSEVVIITSLRSIVTIIASIIFLHESFNVQKMIGTAIILVSVLLVTNQKKSLKFNNGVIFAIGSSLFYGSAIVIDAYILKSFDPLSYLAITNFFIVAVLVVFNPKVLYKLQFLKNKKFLGSMSLIAILSASQAIAYYYALKLGNSSQIAPIGQSQIIVTVFLAAIILKERDHMLRKVIAAGLVMVGVLLLR